jgi:hypothetical protein
VFSDTLSAVCACFAALAALQFIAASRLSLHSRNVFDILDKYFRCLCRRALGKNAVSCITYILVCTIHVLRKCKARGQSGATRVYCAASRDSPMMIAIARLQLLSTERAHRCFPKSTPKHARRPGPKPTRPNVATQIVECEQRIQNRAPIWARTTAAEAV